MFRAVATVRDQIVKDCDIFKPIDLEAITKFVKGLTVIDDILFVQYDVPPDNPIWGEFRRWTRSPGVYVPFETRVEIRYASHLGIPWRRHVVVKELCHALDETEGSHSASDSALTALISAFAIKSTRGKPEFAKDFSAEVLADICATELLCPLPARREIVRQNGGKAPDANVIADQYQIPIERCAWHFDADYMDVIESLLDGAPP